MRGARFRWRQQAGERRGHVLVRGAGETHPSRGSYVWMSVIISLLPLGMLGAIIGYIVLKTRAADDAEKR